MSEIQGALGLVQLSRCRGHRRASRNEEAHLDAVANVKGLSLRALPDRNGEIATQVAFILPDADAASASRRRRRKRASDANSFRQHMALRKALADAPRGTDLVPDPLSA
jgi:dTDP-4-amino-4,6-dideoxygalactose transaminase